VWEESEEEMLEEAGGVTAEVESRGKSDALEGVFCRGLGLGRDVEELEVIDEENGEEGRERGWKNDMSVRCVGGFDEDGLDGPDDVGWNVDIDDKDDDIPSSGLRVLKEDGEEGKAFAVSSSSSPFASTAFPAVPAAFLGLDHFFTGVKETSSFPSSSTCSLSVALKKRGSRRVFFLGLCRGVVGEDGAGDALV
jgi:hypothetical protein